MLIYLHTVALSTTPIGKHRHYERISKKPIKKFKIKRNKREINNIKKLTNEIDFHSILEDDKLKLNEEEQNNELDFVLVF